MLVGTSSFDITPDIGTELCGFANRAHPADHVLDPLYASVLYLDESGVKIILINLDLIGVENSYVQRIRSEIKKCFDIPENHIQIFATHTHSGPGTIHLNYCGEYYPEYLDSLVGKVLSACNEAFINIELCKASFFETEFQLGVNRRNRDNSPLFLKSLVWNREDGSCKAVFLNYPMHPVCLKGTGISADYPGVVKRKLEEMLPGNPLIMFGLGASGDIDPPKSGVSVRQMGEWGSILARTAVNSISSRSVDREIGENIRMGPACPINIPLRTMGSKEVDEYADKYLSDKKWNTEYGPVFQKAVEKWRGEMKERKREENSILEISVLEISVLEIGVLKLIFVSAELFSGFERLLQSRIETPFMVVSCANGLEGYLPAQEEYDKGGYEVETALFFYNSFMPEPGSLEMLADEIIKLL